MKHIFITLLMLFMPVLTTIVFANKKIEMEKMIILKTHYHDSERESRDKRTITFIPIKASYDNTDIYLKSWIQIENATIRIKDKRENIMYELCTTLSANEEFSLPIHLGKGIYTLEIVNGNTCYYGDFEI
ncbi:hypothetical protein Bacsa_2288 [Phocaeicola salanitronis DSM 18170]|uniref:DUF3244 domain-containing protein n=1 Tax=Phocaeicola salanitronis (strain DSM 18170 / JCM 13657 / CCUG 60908 / BL78) TaxID=667015 RepID=F0R6E9_PHOSB|nr:DUF3244 domain-containing protein [Phocaeicola salanitronis]ADY36837.1 hypothetical protein Bacsa_2288 [Phocaeicola salanitronis DSM 18170]